MKYVNFKPWVGKDYVTGGVLEKKVLVLGESHYCNREANHCLRCCKENFKDICISQTNDLIIEYLKNYRGESYLQTLICFERAVLGKIVTNEERKDFWNSDETILEIDNENKTPMRIYEINGKRIQTLCVYHPSTPKGKSWSYWHQFYCGVVLKPSNFQTAPLIINIFKISI